MKSFIITLKGNLYSEDKSNRCIETAKRFDVHVEKYPAVDKFNAKTFMKACGLKWTWKNGRICPKTKLYMKPYRVKDWGTKIGCSMSHYLLWQMCEELNEPILILEHDAVFVSPLPSINFKFACQINDPMGATPKGKWWSEQMKKRNKNGVFPKTIIPYPDNRPDGLAGNGSYMITPNAATTLIEKTHEIGLWINDAFLCRQLFSELEEYYPYITRIKQEISTSSL